MGLKSPGIIILITGFLLLIPELALRLGAGLPIGRFNFILNGHAGLYPPNQLMEMTWGPIPYIVKTNSLGFRGREIKFEKKRGCTRILTIGDSMTDGYFVDNDATYPHFLEAALADKTGCIEVINGARGGGSIGRAFSVLKALGFPLKPDLVLLTFVTNDISELHGQSLDGLLNASVGTEKYISAGRLLEWALVHTALGEWIGDRWLRMRFERYAKAEDAGGGARMPYDESRYAIRGGNDYDKNVAIFNSRFGRVNSDAAVLNDNYLEIMQPKVSMYLSALEEMKKSCDRNAAVLAFVYFPAYPQVYGDSASVRIRDILQDACASMKIPFIDLLPAFREKGREAVYHLAPLDFHTNPRGNRLMADVIAGELVRRGMLKAD